MLDQKATTGLVCISYTRALLRTLIHVTVYMICCMYWSRLGARGSIVLRVLSYKLEGLGFET
jgi:hypothetical protein